MEWLEPTPKFVELVDELGRGEYTKSGLLSDAIFDVLDVFDLRKRKNGRVVYLDSDKLVSEHYFPDEDAAQEIERMIKAGRIDREYETKAIEMLRKRKERIAVGVFFAKSHGDLRAILVFPDSYLDLFEGDDRERAHSAWTLAHYFLGKVPLNGYVPL